VGNRVRINTVGKTLNVDEHLRVELLASPYFPKKEQVMIWKKPLVGLVAAGLVLAGVAWAAEQSGPLPGKIHVVKPAKLIKLVAKSKAIDPDTFDLPDAGGAEDPTINGATLVFADLGLAGGSVAYELDASGWSALGNPPGAKGYKYKSKDDVNVALPKEACTVVLIKDKTIKAVCKKSSVTLDTPYAGLAAINLGIPGGTAAAIQYCWEFGGDTKKNDDKLLKRKDAPAPGGCVPLL
jgi:hypothetical protein